MCVGAHVPWPTCRDQRRSCSSWFSLPVSLRNQTQVTGLTAGAATLLLAYLPLLQIYHLLNREFSWNLVCLRTWLQPSTRTNRHTDFNPQHISAEAFYKTQPSFIKKIKVKRWLPESVSHVCKTNIRLYSMIKIFLLDKEQGCPLLLPSLKHSHIDSNL